MLICGQEFGNETIARIRTTIGSEPGISRRALARRVCRWLDWRAPNGNLKDMSARSALLILHRRGTISLPEAGKKNLFVSQEKIEPTDIPYQIHNTPLSLEQLGEIDLIPVSSRDKGASRTWNGLMNRFHPLGAGPLCGAQMRYLIKSAHYGYIGGLAFSAAAWRIAARDSWIGWNDETRRKNLQKVICNSRFLLLPKVPNLASHILARCLKDIPHHWQERYNINPVLVETYVEHDTHRGVCYRAANWRHIGTTKGRGRMDKTRTARISVKDIYVFPLVENPSKTLCCDTPVTSPAKPQISKSTPAAPLSWAEEEFGKVDLRDRRMTKRLVSVARDMYARPQANIPQACQTRARAKAAYRFFAHPATKMDKILEQHYEQTRCRAAQESVVLAAQDTTSLNYTTHDETVGIGPIGSSLKGPVGLLLHDTMIFNEAGTPLGLLDVQLWARDPEQFGKKHLRHQLPIEEKESFKWLKSFEKVAEAQKKVPGTVFVSVGDREADIYELFELALANPAGPKLLVRSMTDRALDAEQDRMWKRVEREPVCQVLAVNIPRTEKKPARSAFLEIRYAKVTVKPPKGKSKKNKLTLWAVWAKEIGEKPGVDPIEWKLITTCEVNSPEDAVRMARWYAGRWGVEVYHRTLKSGCKVEARQLRHSDHIEACLAVDMVVAWRVFHITKLSREKPDAPCTECFEDHEWKAVQFYWTKHQHFPASPPSLREVTRMAAQLGGFLGRKCDGEPGTQALWTGLQRLSDIASMYKSLISLRGPHLPDSTVSSDPPYG